MAHRKAITFVVHLCIGLAPEALHIWIGGRLLPQFSILHLCFGLLAFGAFKLGLTLHPTKTYALVALWLNPMRYLAGTCRNRWQDLALGFGSAPTSVERFLEMKNRRFTSNCKVKNNELRLIIFE